MLLADPRRHGLGRIIVGKHTENDSLLGAVGLVLRHQTKELSLG